VRLVDPPEWDDLPPSDDQTLWEQAARGDKAAFGELYRRHAEAVWNYAYRLTGSWATAEDLTSNTFLAAWRKLGEMTLVNASARPWLYTVASNLARHEYRRAGRFSRVLSRVPLNDTTRDHAEDVAAQIDADRRLKTVLDAVAKLPKGERQAVELCLLGELPTAEARVSRARSRLRGLLGGMGLEEGR